MKLIVGLGNPGKEYENTRHNVGFLFIDKLSTEVDSQKNILLKPQTFMNNSGMAVRTKIDFYKLSPADLIVIHDDKDLLLGEYKIQKDRGAAGHNGVQSIIDHLGTRDFMRVRIGIAHEDKQTMGDTADFVLNKFTKEEKEVLNKTVDKAIEEVKKILL